MGRSIGRHALPCLVRLACSMCVDSTQLYLYHWNELAQWPRVWTRPEPKPRLWWRGAGISDSSGSDDDDDKEAELFFLWVVLPPPYEPRRASWTTYALTAASRARARSAGPERDVVARSRRCPTRPGARSRPPPPAAAAAEPVPGDAIIITRGVEASYARREPLSRQMGLVGAFLRPSLLDVAVGAPPAPQPAAPPFPPWRRRRAPTRRHRRRRRDAPAPALQPARSTRSTTIASASPCKKTSRGTGAVSLKSKPPSASPWTAGTPRPADARRPSRD